MKKVLQVGDIANVAADLSEALRLHSDWQPVSVDVARLRRQARLSQLADLPIRAARTRAMVRSAIIEEGPAVVHLHWARYAPFISTDGVPLVVHVHGSDVRSRTRNVSGRLVRRALSAADVTLVSTPDLLADTPDHSTYLPNPVNVDLFTPSRSDPGATRSLSGPTRDPGRPPVVLIFARLVPIKGPAALLAAAAAIRSLDPRAKVLALGGGDLDHLAASAGIEVVPKRRRSELPELLRSVDVVIGQALYGGPAGRGC